MSIPAIRGLYIQGSFYELVLIYPELSLYLYLSLFFLRYLSFIISGIAKTHSDLSLASHPSRWWWRERHPHPTSHIPYSTLYKCSRIPGYSNIYGGGSFLASGCRALDHFQQGSCTPLSNQDSFAWIVRIKRYGVSMQLGLITHTG